MSNRKKILILTPRFPFPIIGGDRLRIYFLCKELSKTYDLTLISLCESQEEMDMDVSSDPVFSSVARVLQPKWKSYFNCLLAIPTKIPLQVAYYRNSNFKRKLNELLPSHNYALAHLVRTGDYLLNSDIPKVLEMTDAISMNYERVGKIAKLSGFKNFVYSIEQKRLKQYEQFAANKFDASILVSQIDKDYLFASSNDEYQKVLVCSNGVDTNDMSYELSENSKQLVFIGNLYSAQNFDAAYWFALNVMPLLRKQGDFTFKVIGRIKDKDRQKLNYLDGVFVTGSVDSVITEARNSLAGICSVRLGAGVQNKILEYMALGIPTITSAIGLEGLEANPNIDILIANEPQEYVDAIIKLSINKKFRESVSIKGREYVENNHSWESRLSPIMQLFDKL